MTNFFLDTVWFTPFYGLLGAIATLPWSLGFIRRTGQRPAIYLNILMTVLALVHGILAFQQVLSVPTQRLVFPWLQVADLDLTFTLELSEVTLGAMTLVALMSLMAQLFGLGYLEKEWALARFYGLLGFFEAALSGLALSDSLFLSYALLEMLTLSTYLLVGFWFAQPLVVTAARDAFLTKRVGDILLLMGIVALSVEAGSLNFQDLYEWAETATLSPVMSALLGLALIAGPTGKCAQFPLNLWLDEAMEGPSPASILRNSVVLSAGAYILIKLQPILVLSPVACTTLVVLGTITAVGTSLVAIAQVDIKRALCHSSSAFLGLVFISVGLQWTSVALLVLLAHGVAKVLLFMSAGSVSLNSNCQNMVEMGGLWSKMPATTAAFVVGSVGLIGLFPLGGFWALREGIHVYRFEDGWIVGVFLLVNVLNALNLTRIFRLVFLGPAQPKVRRSPEAPWPMAVPMVSMVIIAFVLPVILRQLAVIPDWDYIALDEVAWLVGSGIVGCTIGALIPLNRGIVCAVQPRFYRFQQLLAYDFYVDRFYQRTIVTAVASLSKLSYLFDRYVVDGVVNLVGAASIWAGEGLRYGVSGQSQGYVLLIMVSISLIGVFLTWSLW
jgi:NAD(P)H-quinone oxidoreductase subunit 5